MRERGLHLLKALIENFTDGPGKKSYEGHGQKGNQRQAGIDIEHETNRSGAQDESIGKGHQPHASGQLYCLNVVGGVSHKITGISPVEVGKRESLQVGE